MTGLQRFTPREAYAKYMLGAVLVDVQEPTEKATIKTVGVRNVLQLPLSELQQRVSELPDNRTVVLVSRAGIRSAEAGRFLLGQGFEDVATIEGGLESWEMEGLPLR
jgi:rhodanese-related sulfurtransferase